MDTYMNIVAFKLMKTSLTIKNWCKTLSNLTHNTLNFLGISHLISPTPKYIIYGRSKLRDLYLENRNEIIVKDKQIERQKKIIRSLRNRLNSEIEMHNRNLEYIHSLHAMKCNEWMITDSIEFPSYDYQKAVDEDEDDGISLTESDRENSDDECEDTLSTRGYRTM